jgi:ketosteroid isomerase-like protein/mono/diheme cytochrome c family protein
MKTLKTILTILLVLLLLVIGGAWSGLYSVAADAPHTRPVFALLELLRERSVAARVSAIEVPLLDEEALIRAGAGNYDAMCSGCHLAPDMAETELSRGLYPAPPNLAQSDMVDPAAAFWTIKHGIKTSGMPAWGKSMEDSDIWGMVALLQRLPKMTSKDYRALVDASGGHSHGAGEAGRGHDSQTDPEEHPHDAGAPGTAAEGGREKEHDHDDHPHEAVEDAPLAVAQTLQAALSAGDVGAVEALLDPQVLILESGGAERSRAEYAAHHMQSDMAFLQDTQYTLLHQTGDRVGDLAWVASEASITGRSGDNAVALMSTETLVLEKAAKGWRIVHVHWSSRPAAGPSAQLPVQPSVQPKE